MRPEAERPFDYDEAWDRRRERRRLERERRRRQLRRQRAAALLGALVLVAGVLVAATVLLGGGSTAPARAPARAGCCGTFGVPAYVRPTLPFAAPTRLRLPRAGEVPSLYADERTCSTGCKPVGVRPGWPLRPFGRQHPLRAGINELRTGSLHVGLDIQARDGQRVYAVQGGRARILAASGPDARVQVGSYVYWHVVPRVRAGERVVPYRTIVGTVMRDYGHIAFSERDSVRGYVNPLRPGGRVLTPWRDRRAPVVGEPSVARDGQVVAAAYDPQSDVERTTYVTPVLAPAGVAYRLYDSGGRAATPLEWAVRGTHLEPFAVRSLIYTPGAHAPGFTCFERDPVCRPHWVYRVAGGLAAELPTTLAPGRYRLTVYAWDWADNVSALDTPVTLGGDGWQPRRRFPASLLPAPLTPVPTAPATPATPVTPVTATG